LLLSFYDKVLPPII